MTKEQRYALVVKVIVTPMEYLTTPAGRFDSAVSEALRVGTEELRNVAGKEGLRVIDSTHYYEAEE